MEIGDKVEDFELPDQDGQPRRLSAMLRDGPVVLFFYPAAMSRGCTAEVCHFRDLAAEFRQAGAQPVGISADAVDQQRDFAGTHDVPFPLLSDAEKKIAKRFGVRRIGLFPLKRRTFVIGTNSRVIEVVRSELNMEAHADQALGVLQ